MGAVVEERRAAFLKFHRFSRHTLQIAANLQGLPADFSTLFRRIAV